MIILKVIGIAFVALCCINVLRSSNRQEFSVILIIASGVIILLLISDKVVESVSAFSELTKKSGLKGETISLVIKMVGIGYVTEYSASVCEDGDSKSLAQKIQLAGKITVFFMAMPIIMNVFDVIGNLV